MLFFRIYNHKEMNVRSILFIWILLQISLAQISPSLLHGGQWWAMVWVFDVALSVLQRSVDMAIIAWYRSSGFANIWPSSFSSHHKFIWVCLSFLILMFFAFWFWFLSGFCARFFSDLFWFQGIFFFFFRFFLIPN